jgi:hypothetical protein
MSDPGAAEMVGEVEIRVVLSFGLLLVWKAQHVPEHYLAGNRRHRPTTARRHD